MSWPFPWAMVSVLPGGASVEVPGRKVRSGSLPKVGKPQGAGRRRIGQGRIIDECRRDEVELRRKTQRQPK